jgi:hypothetical protein
MPTVAIVIRARFIVSSLCVCRNIDGIKRRGGECSKRLRVNSSVQSPPLRRQELFGGFLSQTRTPPDCGICKGRSGGVSGTLTKGAGRAPSTKTPRARRMFLTEVGHDQPVRHAFLKASGALTEWTPRAGAGCPRSLAHPCRSLARGLSWARIRRDHRGGMTAASHTRSRHEQPDRRAGASRSLPTKDTGRAASPPWP